MCGSGGARLGDTLEDRDEDVGEWADPDGVGHGADPDGAADVHAATNPIDEESGGEEREAGCIAEHLTKGAAPERAARADTKIIAPPAPHLCCDGSLTHETQMRRLGYEAHLIKCERPCCRMVVVGVGQLHAGARGVFGQVITHGVQHDRGSRQAF